MEATKAFVRVTVMKKFNLRPADVKEAFTANAISLKVSNINNKVEYKVKVRYTHTPSHPSPFVFREKKNAANFSSRLHLRKVRRNLGVRF